jgi:hypothetical protein
MLQWLQEAMQHQQQQHHGIPNAAADPCWLVTGGVSMQAAAWAGACSLGLLQNGLTKTIRAAAVVQQRCWDEIPELAEKQQQHQQGGQGSTPWMTQLEETTIRQPHNSLLLAQLLLCSVEQFSSNGAATFAALAQHCSCAADLAIHSIMFTGDHAQAVQQDNYNLLCEWLEPVLPATLRLLSHASHLLDQEANSPAGSSSSSATQPVERDTAQQSVTMLLQLLVVAAYYTSRYPAAAAVAEMGRTYALPWQTHCGEISSRLEEVLRILGRRPTPGFTGPALLLISTLLGKTACPPGRALVQHFSAAPPGSPAQLQLFSMLCSLLKVGSIARLVDDTAGDSGCWAAAHLNNMLSVEGMAKLRAAAALKTQAAELTFPKHLTAEAVGGLVLAGRCCLHWAAALGQLQSRSDLGQLLMQLRQLQGDSASAWSVATGLNEWHALIAMWLDTKSLAGSVLSTCLEWLQEEGKIGQLTAAGYPAEAAMQQVQEVLDVLPEPFNAPDAAAAESALGLLVQQLQGLGLVLNTLAVPHACNNPACTSLAAPTELATVSRRSCMCAGCRVARYCSRVCQKQHWKQHKPVCKALAGAAAAEQGQA